MTIERKRGRNLQHGLVVLAAGAVVMTGCASNSGYDNRLRPAATLQVGANIGADVIAAAPRQLGAGRVRIVATNQSGASQVLTITGTSEATGRDRGLRQSTAPISPQGTATLSVDLNRQGQYTLRVRSSKIKPAQLEIGPPRPSAQNDLLTP